MDRFGALSASGDELERRLVLLPGHRLDVASVSPGWSLYDLVNHVIGGGWRYLMLLRGAHAAELTASRARDHIGEDAVAAYRESARALAAEFAAPGALERTVHHRSGDRSGLVLLHMRVLEQALHGWDIAATLGTEGGLDEELAEYMIEHCLPIVDELQGTGLFAPALDRPPSANASHALLRATGRDPAATGHGGR